jgi:hypothetical protein
MVNLISTDTITILRDIMVESNGIQNSILPMSHTQLLAFRLRHHHLDRRMPLSSLVTVVKDVCGVQAQLTSAAQIALWARVEDLTPEGIEHALWQDRTLVKAWCMRGAVHFLPTSDFLMYIGALGKSILYKEQQWITRCGITIDDINNMIEAIVKALASESLTRQELTEQVVDLLGSKFRKWIEHSWGGIVKQACLKGLVCFGPNRGREVTFIRRDRWLPHLNSLPIEDAQDSLLQQYLCTYGPATLQDFCTWSGMSMKEATRIRERLRDKIVNVTRDEKTALVLREDLGVIQKVEAIDQSVRLLPSFDPYMLGHRQKTDIVDEAYYKQVYRKAGWLSPVVILNGRVIGTWSHKCKGEKLQAIVQLFNDELPKVLDKIKEEGSSLGSFLKKTCEITFRQMK